MIRVGIVGGSGYTGVELLRLLARHQDVTLAAITSRKDAGTPVAAMFPSLRGAVGLAFSDPAQAPLTDCDLVFFATPNGVAMEQAPALLEAGVRVIDLSADFRIRDRGVWERWYGMSHVSPHLLADAVYGLPELHRERIRDARLVANPGCYPTAVRIIRERFKFRDKVRVLSAEGKFSAVILVALPLLLIAYLQLTKPTYLNYLTTEPTGKIIITAAASMLLIGIVIIRRLIKIDI